MLSNRVFTLFSSFDNFSSGSASSISSANKVVESCTAEACHSRKVKTKINPVTTLKERRLNVVLNEIVEQDISLEQLQGEG